MKNNVETWVKISLSNGAIFEDGKTSVSFNIGPTKQKFKKYEYPIYTNGKKTAITIEGITNTKTNSKGKAIYIDNITITLRQLTLKESADNTETLESFEDKATDIKLTRSLSKDYWNTLCLPFALNRDSIDKIFGGNTVVEQFKNVDTANETMNFEAVDHIEAGTPYLIKPENDVVNPVFYNVRIEATTPQKNTEDGYGFAGTFGPTEINSDGTHLFLTADSRLNIPATDKNTLPGFRGYFIVPSGATKTRIAFPESTTGITTAIHHEVAGQQGVYTLGGQRINTPVNNLRKGIYIINGKKTIIQ